MIDKPVMEMTAPEHWAFFFRYLTDRTKREKINEIMGYEEGIAMASEELMRISRDEVERARLMSEYKYVVDTQSKVVHARREGIREGKREGKLEERLEIAKRFKKLNIPVKEIAEGTGLTEQQIADL
jgi:predicted transposase/invertase (TIGR01784 family)